MAVTIRDVARRLGLSHTTVSLVLNNRYDVAISEPTRQRVIKVATEMGYVANPVARALTTGRTHTVAFWSWELVQPHYASALAHFYRYAAQRHYRVMVSRWDTVRLRGAASPLAGWPVDGLITLDLSPEMDQAFAGTSTPRPPIVCMGAIGSRLFDSVRVDLYGGCRRAVAHLLERCEGRIVYVADREGDPGEQRWRAYHEAMAEAGREPEVLDMPNPLRSTARVMVRDYVHRRGCPEAILCHNDDRAIGVYRGLRDLGLRIPQDVALVGFDGIEDGEYLDSPLTTVAIPYEQMCERAWELLERRMAEPRAPVEEVMLQPRLIVRQSSALSADRIPTGGAS